MRSRLICAGPSSTVIRRQLGERQEARRSSRHPGCRDAEIRDALQAAPHGRVEAHLDVEALLAFDDRADRPAPDRLDHLQGVVRVDPVACDGIPVDAHPKHRQPLGLLGLHVRGAWDAGEDAHDLVGLGLEKRQVVAVQVHGDVGADPGDELRDPQLDRLREAEDGARDLRPQRLVERRDERLAVREALVVARFEDDVGVADLDAHRIGRDFGAAGPRDDRRHLREFGANHLLDLGADPIRFLERDAGQGARSAGRSCLRPGGE